jgi:hypothetical protein
MALPLDDHYLRGPLKYYEGEFTWGQRIYFFSDEHVMKARCPPDAPRVSLSSFFHKIFRWNPDKTFHLLLEVPGHMDITIAPQNKPLFISQVYQQVYKKKEPNLVTHGIDIRYPGIKRALTILKKTSTILKNIVYSRNVVATEKKKLIQMFPQLLQYFEDIDVKAYVDLFIKQGKLTVQPRFLKSLPSLQEYVKTALYRYELELTVLEILQTVLTRTSDEKLPDNPFLSLFLEKIIMVGVWLTDLATLLQIFSIPDNQEIIVFAGRDHIRNVIEILMKHPLPPFFITEEVSPDNQDYYQCLAIKDMMKTLRPLKSI